MSSLDPSMVESGSYVYINRYPFCKYLSYVRTAFGIFTVFLIWYNAIAHILSITSFPIGIYLAVIGCPTFLLEFGKVIRVCCGQDGPLCSVFSLVLGFDRWKRGIFYCLLSVACFFPSITTTSAQIAGVMLFLLGVLYTGKMCQKKKIPTYVSSGNSA